MQDKKESERPLLPNIGHPLRNSLERDCDHHTIRGRAPDGAARVLPVQGGRHGRLPHGLHGLPRRALAVCHPDDGPGVQQAQQAVSYGVVSA